MVITIKAQNQIEQMFNGVMFDIKEFRVKNGMRGQGIGTEVYREFEKRLKERNVREIILLTSKGIIQSIFIINKTWKRIWEWFLWESGFKIRINSIY